MDWPTFLLMTFVMFFVVGPVEEFQFRSFAHDQSQRVFPKWAALIFSSVFFGLSHIPIAIFIYMPTYNLKFIDLVFMELSWMAAGATFGALYMWSRNIYACIVMHGIGNWQLSVFAIRNISTEMGLTGTNAYISDLTVTIFANGLMILLFFLVHKYYWEPQRKGEAAFGGRLLALQKFLFSHDNGTKNGAITGGGLAGVTFLVLVLIFGTTSAFGFDSESVLSRTSENSAPSGEFDLQEYNMADETILDSMNLDEGQSSEYALNSSSKNVIDSVKVTIRWDDESQIPVNRLRPYENQPDTFNLTIMGQNISAIAEASNPPGGTGSIILEVDVQKDYLNEVMGHFNLTVTVTMKNAGMWVPTIGPGIIVLTDHGNEYDISIEISRLQSDDYEEIAVEEVPDVEDVGIRTPILLH
ncbi:MAG: CPBP family intramembrane glutamic endopeptidase, partial [Candidatus Thermoplasmatota archaeon]|nr:CPBP family intramembrane glutamic endopeptidase [Candidatus Thermoplasmatota archaeon]